MCDNVWQACLNAAIELMDSSTVQVAEEVNGINRNSMHEKFSFLDIVTQGECVEVIGVETIRNHRMLSHVQRNCMIAWSNGVCNNRTLQFNAETLIICKKTSICQMPT